MALLVSTGASVLTNWLYAHSWALHRQMVEIARQRLEAYIAQHPQLTPKQQQELHQQLQLGMRFSLPRSLIGGLFSNTVALLSLLGLLWLVQPLVWVRWGGLRLGVIVTAFGYTVLWSACGEVLTAVFQVIGGSLQVQPSLAAFVVPEQQPVLFAALSRFHLGTLLQFGILGFLLKQAAALPLWRAMAWSYSALLLWVAAIYGMGIAMT